MDRADLDWIHVIKVKYGNILRRFNAHGDGEFMDTNMEKLREKIISFFKLSPDVDIIMTYTDVDGDLVTLVNDDELKDAVLYQHLNPLRIDVQLNTNHSANNADAKSHPSNSAEISPPQSLPMNFTLSDALKSVPEPIGSAISKLSQDILSKTVESAPAVTAMVEQLTKLGLRQAVSLGTTLQGDLPINNGGVPADLPNLEACSSAKPVDQNPENKEKQSGTAAAVKADPHKKDVGQWSGEFATNTSQLSTSLIDQGQNFGVNKHQPSTSGHGLTTSAFDQLKNKCPALPDFNCDIETVSGTDRQLGQGHAMPTPNFSSRSFCYPRFLGRSYIPQDDSARVFHCGVQCDNCGMHPIVGVRYKSNLKENYDLCSICFAEMGTDVDYTRIDRPFQNRNFGYHSFRGRGMRYARRLESRFIQDVSILDGTLIPPCVPFTKIWKLQNNGSTPWPFGTQLIWVGGDKFSDTSVVQLEIPVTGFPAGSEIDVAVSCVAPSSPGRFVSYWRLCSPTGQKFGQRVWVIIQVDAGAFLGGYHPFELNLNLPPGITGLNGTCMMDNNFENLVAEHTGFQSGPVDDSVTANNGSNKVVPEIPEIPRENSSSMLTGGNTVVSTYPDFGSSSGQHIATTDSFPLHELVDTAMGTEDNMTESKGNHINDLSQVPPNSSQMKTPTISYPVVDSSLESTITSTKPVPYLLPPVNPASGDVADNNSTAVQAEEALLTELYQMGFTQVDLNKEILRRNEYDLEQSLNDLCDGWDLLLGELQEMGFSDRELNKKLLIKNNGSIKHVVLDLISMEKDE